MEHCMGLSWAYDKWLIWKEFGRVVLSTLHQHIRTVPYQFQSRDVFNFLDTPPQFPDITMEKGLLPNE